MEAAILAAQGEMEGYPKGSTVICAHCFVPLFTLTRSISPGDKANRTASAYRPVTVQEIRALRLNVPSVTAALKAWTFKEEIAHVAGLEAPKSGSPAACPVCHKSFVQVFAPEASEVIDQAYTWRLVTIPPMAGPYPVRSAQVHFG
jgi:hypothetical protein